jgi:hypothetical protein
MDKNLNSLGYDLIDLGDESWVLNVRGGPIYVGTFNKVVKLAVVRLGFSLQEIEFAASTMIEKNHNAAHFGMYRGFIYTFQKDLPNVRKAS